jgi:cytochrome P450 family 12
MIRAWRSSSGFGKAAVFSSGARSSSAQAAVSMKQTEEDFVNAQPFEKMPGLGKFEFLKRFLPGGKFHNVTMMYMQSSLREEFGDLYRLPGLFGQKEIVSVFDPSMVEVIHRNEGVYPHRRGLQTMDYFRRKVRSDIYSFGGLVIE